jgi:hypothetical protein
VTASDGPAILAGLALGRAAVVASGSKMQWWCRRSEVVARDRDVDAAHHEQTAPSRRRTGRRLASAAVVDRPAAGQARAIDHASTIA